MGRSFVARDVFVLNAFKGARAPFTAQEHFIDPVSADGILQARLQIRIAVYQWSMCDGDGANACGNTESDNFPRDNDHTQTVSSGGTKSCSPYRAPAE